MVAHVKLHLRFVLGQKRSGSPRISTRVVKAYAEALPGLVTPTARMVSTPPRSAKATSLKTTPAVGTMSRA